MTNTADSSRSERAAIVFSAGGIKFAVHAGVMVEMEKWKSGGQFWLERFPVLVGTSAGALSAALYACGTRPVTFVYSQTCSAIDR